MKFVCCSSALCVCFWLGRPLGFFFVCVVFPFYKSSLSKLCSAKYLQARSKGHAAFLEEENKTLGFVWCYGIKVFGKTFP